MANQSVTLRDGYQPYFSFLTGFQSQANIVSDVIVDRSFEGKDRVITFADGSKIVVNFKDPSPDWHIFVLNPSQGLVPVGDPQSAQCVVDLGTAPGTSLFDPSFLSTWFAGNNGVQPAENATIAGDQTLNGYGGDDDVTGSIGNDRIIDDHGGLVRLAGGPSDGNPTGNDTFVFTAGVIVQGNGGRGTTIAGTDRNFFGNYTAGEINTIEAQGNNDFSFADIYRMNRIAFNGATQLLFGAGQFRDSGNDGFHSYILPSATVMGDAGANAFVVYANPADISAGHSNAWGSPDFNLSQLVFQNWTAGQDTVTIYAAATGFAGSPVIVAPNVNSMVIGGQNDENITGGSGNDTIIGAGENDTLNGGGGNDRLYGGVSFASFGLNGARDVVADFNGDGKADVLQIETAGRGNVLLSTGSTLGPYSQWGAGLRTTDQIGDFNGDGKDDIIQLHENNNAYVGTSNGGGFSAYSVWATGVRPSDKIGDFNGDGKDDIIQLHENNNAYVWTSNGASFNAYTVWGFGTRPSDKIGDFNGDGKDDIIQLHENNNAYVWTSNGTSFNAYSVWGFGTRPSDKIGDFNGDGKDDIIQLHENGNAYVWLSNGTSFNAYSTWGSGARPSDQIGDFNGDGKDDIIELHENGNAYVWLSNGTSFGAYSVWGTGMRPIDQIGDFNGDGKDDIIELHQNGNGYVWISNGTSFNAYQVWGTGILGLGDGDGVGDDTFVFLGNHGNDIVTDFQAGAGLHDVLRLDSATWSGVNDVLNHTTNDGLGNTVIAYGGNSITLLHVLKASLVADDFSFV